MRRKETVLAYWYRPIRLAILTSVDHIFLKLNKIPGIKLTSVKTPIDLMNEMPALKITRKSFYANARVKLKATAGFERISTKAMLDNQSDVMKQLIDEQKNEIRQSTLDRYNRFKQFNNS